MRRPFVLFSFFILLFSFFIPHQALAYKSNICAEGGGPCTRDEVGRFMEGISDDCGNQGNCSLEDIMVVIVDLGQFVLGLVGVLVLLMYVMGGFWILSSHGNKTWVDKGHSYISVSTIGLLIVMLAYIGINLLLKTLAPNYSEGFLSACVAPANATAEHPPNDGEKCNTVKMKTKDATGKEKEETVIYTCQNGVCLPPPPPKTTP